MNSNTRRMKIKNRCIATGRGRGVLRNFRICRVSVLGGFPGDHMLIDLVQYQFRLLGKAGDLPGIKKANW